MSPPRSKPALFVSTSSGRRLPLNLLLPSMDAERRAQIGGFIQKFFIDGVPHNKAIGMRFLDIDRESVRFALDYDPRFAGHPETGVMHGGVITAFMDSCSGAAVMSKIRGKSRAATLDLRIDYMKPAPPGETLICEARCYRTTRHIAFVRAETFIGTKEQLIATSSATFALMPFNASKMREAFTPKKEGE